MWSRLVRIGLAGALASVGLVIHASAQATGGQAAGAPPNTKTFEQELTVTAKVQAIDLAKREVTLKGPLGNVETVAVSEDVKRLNEIKVGDDVVMKYYIGIAAELRAPTADEQKEPFMVLQGQSGIPSAKTPTGAAARVIRIVATVEGLDRPSQTVTLKGPGGRYLTVRVADPKILEKPRLGDTVIVTCAETLAVSIEKAKSGA